MQRNGFAPTRRTVLGGTAAFGFAALVAPKLGWTQDGRTVLRARSYSDIQVMDPAFRLSAPEGDIMNMINTGLVNRKPGDEWGWELGAAKSIEQVDPTHIKFELRDDITFTDGEPLTAHDVKFSYERIADPANKSPYKDDWAVLDHVEVTGPHSGMIVLKEPFAPLWASTLPTPSGHILSKKAVEAAGGKFTTEIPASAGPYILKEWIPKQKTILVKNPDWTGTPGVYDEVQIFPIEDEKTAELGFEAGDLDYTWTSVSSLPAAEEGPAGGCCRAWRSRRWPMSGWA